MGYRLICASHKEQGRQGTDGVPAGTTGREME